MAIVTGNNTNTDHKQTQGQIQDSSYMHVNNRVMTNVKIRLSDSKHRLLRLYIK
jgi:hypothetical protein